MEKVYHSQQSSITINKTSKSYTWSVKAYGDTTQEISDKTSELIKEAEDKISLKRLNEEIFK